MVDSTLAIFASICLGAALLMPHAFAQTPPDVVAITTVDEAIDELLQFVEQDEGSYLVDELLFLYDNPIDINDASANEISSLPTVSRLQASRLASVRNQADAPLSAGDVLDALQLTDAHFTAIRPFITIAAPKPSSSRQKSSLLQSWQGDWMQRYTRRLDLSRGYIEEDGERAYQGTPERHYSRIRARNPRAQFNLTFDKAAGEVLEWEPRRRAYLFPHQAAYLQLNDIGPVSSAVLGDFSVGFGEGLTLSPMRMASHGRDPFAPASSGTSGIRPFGSSMRNQSFRGIATTVDVTKEVQLTGFWSSTDRDATVDSVRMDNGYTLRTTGPAASSYYRTTTERARKARLPARTAGAAATYDISQWQVGVVGYHTTYGAEIRLPDTPHRSLQFEGSSASMIGFFGEGYTEAGKFFGEVAHSPSRSLGFAGGFHTDLTRYASVLTSLRYLPADFDGLHGASFTAVGGTPQNEHGWYTGLRIQPHEHWTIDAYLDHQYFPWLRHYFALPSTGFDSRLTLQYEPYRWLTSFVEIRYRLRDDRYEVEDQTGRAIVGVRPKEQHSLRGQVRYQFSPAIRVQLRADAKRSQQAADEAAFGTLLYADLRVTPQPWLRVDQRIAFFDADSFDASLYAYESDLLYSFNLPALHRTGQRAYLMVTVQPLSFLYLQAKYAQTRYENVEVIGSGWDEIEGNKVRELRMQMRIHF